MESQGNLNSQNSRAAAACKASEYDLDQEVRIQQKPHSPKVVFQGGGNHIAEPEEVLYNCRPMEEGWRPPLEEGGGTRKPDRSPGAAASRLWRKLLADIAEIRQKCRALAL